MKKKIYINDRHLNKELKRKKNPKFLNFVFSLMK